MNLLTISSISIVITSLLIGVVVLSKGKNRRIAKIWSGFCLSVALWGSGGAMISFAHSEELAFMWWRVSICGIIFIPVFYYHFVYALSGSRNRFFLGSVYICAAVCVFYNFVSPNFIGGVKFLFNQFYWIDWWKKKDLLFLAFAVYFYGFLLLYSFARLCILFLRSKGIERTRYKYFLVGSLVGWIGGESNFLITFGINIHPHLNSFIALYTLIFAYAIIKHRLMDIKIAITRTGVFLIVYTFTLGLPFYIGSQTKSWVLATFFAVFLGTLGPLLYGLLRRKAEGILLAHQRQYQHILLQAARGMVREHNLTRLLKLIVYMLKRVVKVKFAVMFFYDKESKTYLLKTARGNKIDFPSVIFDEDFFLISYIKKISSPFVFEEMPFDMQKKLKEQFGISFSLIIPSIVKEGVLAFLVLGEKLDKSAYSDDDINVFTILSRQAALAIENCMFLEEFKEIQLQLFQAEKLASIGGIADGVAHQIKNRLNQFSLASGELKLAVYDFKENNAQIAKDEKGKEFFKYLMEIADSLTSNVKRTDDIVRGILNFARTTEKDTFFGDFSFEETVNSCLEVLRIKHSALTLPIQINFNSVRMIWGIRAQLSEVIYNLLDNAYEATQMFAERLSDEEKQKYRPRIILEAEEKKDSYLITISDNGIGVKEEEKQKIFAPFFTTKSSYKSGSGIGMYVAKRIVEENHKGKIWFESEYLKGGRFFIKLPKPKDSPSSPPPFIIEDNADGTK